ncbi:MAG: hypothetical protein ACXABY_30255 [Candidatus Thorarchaeota archaeon]|jgi:hypothetical protein
MADLSSTPTSELLKHLSNEELLEIAGESSQGGIPGMSELDIGYTPKEVGTAAPYVAGAIGGYLGGPPGAAVLGGVAELGRQELMEDAPDIPKAGYEAAKQGVYELGGRAVTGAISKAIAPTARHIKALFPEMAEKFAKWGGYFTPAQATDSRIIETVEQIAENSAFGQNKLFYFKANQTEAYGKMVEDMAERIGSDLTPAEIAPLVTEMLERNKGMFMEAAGQMYSKVDKALNIKKNFMHFVDGELVPVSELASPVSTASLDRFSKELVELLAAREGVGASQAGDALIMKISRLRKTLTFKEAQGLRSGLIDEVSMASSKDKAKGIAKKMVSLLDNEMEAAAKRLGPEEYAMWREADAFYKQGKAKFDSHYIKALLRFLDPDRNPAGADMILQRVIKPGRFTQVRKFKQAVGENSAVWNRMKRAYLKDMVETNTTDGVLLGKNFLTKFDKMKDPVLKEMFTPAEIAEIRTIATIGKTLQEPLKGGGGMLIQLAQGNAVLGTAVLLTGKLPKTGGVILVGPWALSKLLVSKRGRRWLIEGVKTPKVAKHAATTLGRIMGLLMESDVMDDVQIVPPKYRFTPLNERDRR